jgi:peptidyl-prolyl cis-trans isomerase D
MLEAIRDRSKGLIAKIILGLLIIPFALWGVDSYFTGDGQVKPAATIDGEEISQREFLKAVRDQKEALGGKVDEKALRSAVIDQLVDTRMLALAAEKTGFSVFDAQITAMLGGVEIFQENGQFSQAKLDTWLRSQDMSLGELMSMLRQEQLLRQVQSGVAEGAVVSSASAKRMVDVLAQEREVNELVFDLASFAKQVNVTDAAISAEYSANKKDYATPRQIKMEYVVLSLTKMEQSLPISDEEARKYYDSNPARFQEAEQRRASHILIPAGADAKGKAEKVLAEVKKSPGRFADLAKQHSQDPGSASAGGDLGAFTRDRMVKPFADAVWSMKVGEISGLVESQFGFHIIRLDGVIQGAKLGFEVAKADIVQTLRSQEAKLRFADAAERFSNMVYEQPESLAPAAKAFDLTIERSDWVNEQSTAPAMLANAQFKDALFADDSLNKRHNTEAIEVAPNTLVAARVVEYQPAGVRALAEVANAIRTKLAKAEARKYVQKAGEQAMAAAQSGKPVAGWSVPMTLSRMQALNVPRDALKAVFRANTSTLPAYVGVATDDAYRVYRINRVAAASAAPPVEQIRADLRRMMAQEEFRAYLESLKAKAKIVVDPASREIETQ